ncbi:MAG TPA: hypothetical protein VNM48_05275, partial [Chloroflexota bacterium]|nr:hypothetical protein [Chloroflexota bacterium]
ELEGLVNREARTAELEQRTAALEAGIVAAASALSVTRGRAGASLAAAVGHEMRALGLKGALHVAVEQEESADGLPVDGERFRFDETGFDVVEFRFAPNPGEPARSVARTASGGELSRILLALKAVLSAADRTATLIFDEVDAGIGGRNGHVIGEKLAQIGGRHQVLCVTHLPQVAAFGDNHFYISKHVDGGRTVTTVVALDDAGRVRELAQMLGGVSTATAQQAQEMITTAEAWKRERGARGGFQVGESVVSTRTAAVAAPPGEKQARLRAKRAVSDRGLQKAPSPHETPTQPMLQGVS